MYSNALLRSPHLGCLGSRQKAPPGRCLTVNVRRLAQLALRIVGIRGLRRPKSPPGWQQVRCGYLVGCNLEWAAKPPRDHLFLGTCRFAATFLPACSCLGLSALLRRTGQQATLSTSYSGILHVVCYSPFDGPRDLRTETGTEREWVRGVRDWQQEMLGRSWAGTPRGFSKRTT